jgi:3-oxoacyl-[acyl-carrier-protein] synthase II
VLGEGAGIVVLEELESAKKRGAAVYGEILGYGTSSDAFRITDVHPEGRGAIQCINAALNDAHLNPEDINYINAHGTSTQINDRVESLAIKSVFKEHAKRLSVSSTKSMTGHLIAAAGGVELEICLLAMKHGIMPPTINYENPDPECGLDYVPNKAREGKISYCLSNSFGFGGQNVSLVIGRLI